MQTFIYPTYDEVSRHAARIVANKIQSKPNAVLGLATGSTPMGLYTELIRLYRLGIVDFSKVLTFNLDEYVGLSRHHPQSYHFYMQNNFFRYINISPHNVHVPRGDAEDLALECQKYEQTLDQAGGVDIQILGIGPNGHIGFNEPGSDPEGKTRVVDLADCTRFANARFFDSLDQVPSKAVSMGIKTILRQSKRILLLANGAEKAAAIKQLIMGEVTSQVPATFLQRHPHVTVLLDNKAAQKLSNDIIESAMR